jgi:PAS domain S-box-containing protein
MNPMKYLPNILIVDDIDVNLALLKTIIASSIHVNLIQALSGAEALEKINGTELALAILDVRMPQMSGFELALKINENRSGDIVPIIFLTAMSSNEHDEYQGYGSGAVDYLYKPIRKNVLLSKINVFIDLYNQKRTITKEAIKLQKTTERLVWTNTALKRSEAKYRSYIESAPDAVFITDENGNYREVNRAATRITGYTKERLLEMSFVDLLTDDFKEIGMAEYKKLVKAGKLKVDLQFKNKNGSKRWWALEAVKLSETRFLGFTIDITQRIELENSLRAYQVVLENQNEEIKLAKNLAEIVSQKYSELYDFAPSGYFTLSIEKIIRELNQSGARILGKDRSLLKNSHFGTFISENSLQKFNIFFQNIYELKTEQACEISLQLSDNQIKHVHIEGLYDSINHQILLNVIDISDLKNIEKVLRESEEKYRTMLNASPDGIFLIDMNGIIKEVSNVGLEMLKVDNKAEIIGNNFSIFIPSDEKNSVIKIYETTLSDRISQNMEVKILRKNKSTFLSNVSSTLISDVDGNPVSFMIILRDISFQKEIETRQIHADRMVSLGQMASGIAHEINQPLNIISMVMDKILFDATKTGIIELEFLKSKSDKIFENITRISNIIDHVRIFSRSHDNYILTAFDINKSIKNACSMLTEQFKHLRISLILSLDKKIPMIIGNTYELEQVIINLLVNAKDALIEKENKQQEHFELIVSIKTWQDGQFVIIEITDNGIGIDNEGLNKAMLPFYTTKEEGKGTGLGLSICYQIIKEMNGTIDIKSESFVGTKIKLILDTQKKK